MKISPRISIKRQQAVKPDKWLPEILLKRLNVVTMLLASGALSPLKKVTLMKRAFENISNPADTTHNDQLKKNTQQTLEDLLSRLFDYDNEKPEYTINVQVEQDFLTFFAKL